jgi:hypothetical protein
MRTQGENRLSQSTAKAVLERAAALDAADGTTVSIDDLRAAAVEAGISPSAFEQALGEAPKHSTSRRALSPTTRHRVKIVTAVVAVVMTTAMVIGVLSELRETPRDLPQPVPEAVRPAPQ